MMNYKLIKKIPYDLLKEDEETRILKNKLTKFVNDKFLEHKNSEMLLLKLIFTELDNILAKYGLFLVFKGGNVLRAISKNLENYLKPIENEIITDVFKPFLKKSDNDFTIYIYPNRPNYDQVLDQVTLDVYKTLEKIKNTLVNNKSKYFDIFKYSDEIQKRSFINYADSIGVKDIKLHPDYNKIIQLEDPEDNHSDTLVYNDMNDTFKFIYNSVNTSIDFNNENLDLVKFYLLRSKVRFKVGDKKLSSGELIDVSIPHRRDFIMENYYNKNDFISFMKENIEYQHNDDYDFSYHTMNIPYILSDLIKILYIYYKKPWNDSKYKKRLARLIYFTMIQYLEENPINYYSHVTIRERYKSFLKALRNIKIYDLEPYDDYLDPIFYYTKQLFSTQDEDLDYQKKFDNYLSDLKFFTKSIIDILDVMIDYDKGNEKIRKEDLYALDL